MSIRLNVAKPNLTGVRYARFHLLGFFALAIPFSLIAAFRGNTPDTGVYIHIFNNSKQLELNPFIYYQLNGVEFGYGVMSWLFHSLHLGWRALFFSISLLTFYFLAKAAQRLHLSFLEILPYYLGSYYLTQQLVQIRQGLGISFAFWIIISSPDRRSTFVKWATAIGIGTAIHTVTVAVFSIASVLSRIRLPARHSSIILWVSGLVICTYIVARLLTFGNLVNYIPRVSDYARVEEFAAGRGIFELAHIRALLVLSLAVLGPRDLLRTRTYQILVSLYAVQLGIRFGFIDFGIVSGRLGSAFAFGEVFILPLFVHSYFRNSTLRSAIGLVYLLFTILIYIMYIYPNVIADYYAIIPPDTDFQ